MKKRGVMIDFLGDFHIMNAAFDEKSCREAFHIIKRDKSYFVLMGDLVDCITPKDKRYDLSCVDPERGLISQGFDLLEELVYPVRKQCLGVLTGNHYKTYLINTITDYKASMCKRLGIRYFGGSAMITIRRPKTKDFIFHCTHGWGGGRTSGAKFNRLYSQISKYRADAYILGHSHKLGDDVACIIESKGWKIKPRYIWLIDSGCFLKGFVKGVTTYAELAQYSPNIIGFMRLHLSGEKVWTEKMLF